MIANNRVSKEQAAMVVFFKDAEEVRLPGWVVDIDSFRRWTDSDEFPDHGNIWWLQGEAWIDMSKEQIFTHIAVKGEYYIILGGLVKAEKRGLLLPDGLLLSNFAADISGNPDLTFISNETLRSDRIRLIEGAAGGFTELQGSPDMVLEVVSTASVDKDTRVLKDAYWQADIREYWLVDARKSPPKFDILRHGEKGYIPARKQNGWMKSEVFGKSFRLIQSTNTIGHPEFRLEVK